MKILIVEDEILIQKSLKMLIEKLGHSVDGTASGSEAIKLIKANNYDKIICDLMLQDLSGFDIIEDSKQKYSLEEISNIFTIITAYSSPQVLEKANNYGCKVLSKPFQDIKSTIDIILNSGK